MGLNPVTGVFMRERNGKFRQTDLGHVKTKAEIGVSQGTANTASSHWRWEEVMKDSVLPTP